MKWRCPQCGKPHDRNDPPCDNCGHHKFERAVVPQATEDEDRDAFVWACPECGRNHQRNNPPCKRCGNGTFEKRSLDYDDFEVAESRSYRELAGRQEAKLAVALLALLSVGVLGYLGVVTIPGITPLDPPTVEDVPGDGERAGTAELDDVERSVLAAVEERRDGPALDRSEGLDATSTYLSRLWVKQRVNDEELQYNPDALRRFETPCDGLPSVAFGTSLPVGDGATADSIAGQIRFEAVQEGASVSDPDVSAVGVGTHTGPDGRVYATLTYC